MRVPLTAVLIGAVGIVTAPLAGADPDPGPDGTTCGKRGGASVCQRPGHSSLHTEPDALPTMPGGRGLVQPGMMPGYGRGQMLPVVD